MSDFVNENEELKDDNKDVEINETKGKKKKEKEPINVKKEILSWISIFFVALAIAYTVNHVIIMNANVPSGSMMNTILKGDRMIGLRTSYWFSDPKRGDIVIFENPDYNENSPEDDKYFVKRVIGEPGDKILIKDSLIFINDGKWPLREDYLPERWVYVNGSDEALVYQVPEDCYFLLGDNRNNSSDARFWENTYVKKDAIIAKAEFKYWSQGKIDFDMFSAPNYKPDKTRYKSVK